MVVFVRGFLGGLGGFFLGGFGVERFGFGDSAGLEHELSAGIVGVSNSLFAGGAAGVGEFFFVFFAGFDGGADFVFDFGARAGVLFAGAGDDGF